MKTSSRNLVKKRVVKLSILSLLFMTLLCIYIYTPSNHRFILHSQPPHCSSNNQSKLNIYSDELDRVLAETSMQNKTLIITVLNKAYCEGDKSMLDIFLDGFWNGENTRHLKDHLLIVAVDQTAVERCIFLGLHCYMLRINGVDLTGEKLFQSKDFIKMMWSRTLFFGEVLKRGYNFIFTDTDVLWMRNPFTRLSSDKSIDLHLSTDAYSNDEWNRDHINLGFYFVKSNNRTISLFDWWYSRRDDNPNEQDVLMKLMHEKKFREIGTNVRYLDTIYFSGYCQMSKDVRSVVTFHTNCCKSIKAKVADLTIATHDWKRYKRASPNETFKWSIYENCGKSWDH